MDNAIDKMKELLSLAGDAKLVFASLEHEFLKPPRQVSFREKVQLSLARKIFYSFDALTDDAGKERAEAMHHLKTMVECFIYFCWIGENEDRAKCVKAEGYKEKIKFFRKNPGYIMDEAFNEWEEGLSDLEKAVESEGGKPLNRPSIELMAKECGDEKIYRIYRLACQPAHIADLIEFEASYSTKRKMSGLWTFVALDYAIFVVCELVRICSEHYNFFALQTETSDLVKRHDKIRKR